MDCIQFTAIGKVVNTFNDISTPINEVKSKPSKLLIYPAYTEALLRIENCEYIDVVFYFHQLEGKDMLLSKKNRQGIEYGVFATRLPERPNLIGVSTVKLLAVNGNELLVADLDALNDSPILDIKATSLSDTSVRHVELL
jgi:formylmethanofuran dehydrogenase subunit E